MAATAAAGLAVVLPAIPAAAAPALPQGFVLQDIPTGLLPGDPITDFGYLPDESLLIIAKNGKVVWTPPGAPTRELARLSVNQTGDLGLIGLGIAPDFAASHTIYTARTMPVGTPGAGAYGLFRFSKWTVATDAAGAPTGLTDEVPIVEATADNDSHGMWGVVAAPDGTLWLSIGDSSDWRRVDPQAVRALDVNDIHGKILHVLPDGSGVPGNPFYTAAAPRSVPSLVYAMGVRSPFRFTLEPSSGRLILGDVGWNAFEEINVVNPGGSYGWPCWEGTAPTTGYRDLAGCAGKTTSNPVWSYPHNGGGAVTGGVFYNGTSYPEEYRGRYFFGDYVFRTLYTLRMGDRGELVTPPEQGGFGQDIGRPVKFVTMPTGGDIVYADIGGPTRLRRLVYAPGNNAPQASVSSTTDPATRTVTFDASDSFDPNGDPLTYRWDFGDGTPPATGPAVISHPYAADPDHFTATVTATDPLSASGTASATVYPSNHAPALNVSGPRDDQTFAVGDTVSATGSATDAEDGALQLSWTATLVHCTAIGVCHQHPGEQQTGPNFDLVFNGHPGESRLEVTASATDARGAVTKQTFVVRPKQRRVTVQSNSPAAFTIGDEQTTTALFTVGMAVSIAAPASAQDGVATFDRWADDSVEQVRQLTVPDADTTLAVTYTTPIDRRYATDGGLRAAVGTPVNPEQGDGTFRFREYSRGRVYWSAQTGVHYVIGGILGEYLAVGGHQAFGLPLTDEQDTPSKPGRFNDFQNGSIYWSGSTGAHEVHGANRAKFLALGGVSSYLGFPITDELPTPNRLGLYNNFQGGSIYFSAATGSNAITGGIRAKWQSIGGEASYLGFPTTDELDTPNHLGRFNTFQGGAIYYANATGTSNIVTGGIRGKWVALGAEAGYLGFPTTDELDTRNRSGRYNNFQNGAIYYAFATGTSSAITGGIRGKWNSLGAETSYLGLPITDELDTSNHSGRYNNFQGGAIYYVHATGTSNAITGGIRGKWQSLGAETSYLGLPITDELDTSNHSGRYNNFQNGSIYYVHATGTSSAITGGIRGRWYQLGAETSYLGLPISDEFAIPGGRRSNFQNGYISYDAATGISTDHRY